MLVALSCQEPSATLLGALVEHELVRRCPSLGVRRLGRQAAVLGFWEGVKAVAAGRKHLRESLRLMDSWNPDLAVLVGTPGFHLPLGRRLRSRGVPVALVAPPQVWAWGSWRTRAVRRAADIVICLLPFEQDLFRAVGVNAVFLGHPLLDVLVEVRGGAVPDGRSRTVLLLPGSRPSEIAFHGPLFREVGGRLRVLNPDLRVVEVPARPATSPEQEIAGARDRYRVMARADAALVVSGTASLELALLGVPQVVCYHLSAPSRIAARLLVRTKHFALPNVLLGRPELAECLEPEAGQLAERASSLLDDPGSRARAESAAADLTRMLGPTGAASRIAENLVGLGRKQPVSATA